MISAIKRFLAEMGGRDEAVAVDEDELQLAAAALLFHVVAVDGVVSDEEREMLSALLGRRFELDPAETQVARQGGGECRRRGCRPLRFYQRVETQARGGGS